MKKALLLFAALIWLGECSPAAAQVRVFTPLPPGPYHNTHGADRFDLKAALQTALDRQYHTRVRILEAWYFHEWQNDGVTACGAVRVNGENAVFVIQNTTFKTFVDIYADESQFKAAGCERPDYGVIVPRSW